MKKLWALGLALLLVAAGCSDNNAEEPADKEKDTKEESTESKDTSGAVMDFYLNLTSTLNGLDGKLNEYEAEIASDEPPTKEELATLKKEAAESAGNVVKELEGMEVSDDLGDVKKDLETFVKTLTESYQMKADALAKEGEVNLDAANGKFTEAAEQIGAVQEEVGLAKSTLENDLNG
ncbi:hypothetical protein JOC86_003560 [Bacillus pakistanensis]|uniref:Lipoprotein n=1 Tax=Rossellomorea pakistanensis TaxID=992288 RepID=A0ABS2NGL9_9BACI|nr:hypothetical protein [Bacillus pakistanensis]MBM7587008.1 hypothetical protein [Bacillus pakistanensis]